jgi:hypothetical protein
MITPTYKSFTNTSDQPYDRHYYSIELNGKCYTFEDYNEVRRICYKTDAVVSIIDYKKTKKRTSDTKGF